jgi:MoaA/NifB/PqqE/SkfB family radical SAM enzyme
MPNLPFLRALRPAANLVAGRPVVAIFEICLRCNSKCGYCDLPLNLGRDELSREDIGRIFKDLYRDGVRHVFVQGGEPFVRRDTIDVLEDLNAIGFRMTVVTNGTRFTPGLVERLSKLRLNIAVSLDSLDRDAYRRIRGADQLQLVLRGIDLLRDFPGQKHLTCIVSEVNRDHVVEVVAFARANGFAPVVGAYHWDIELYGKADPALQYARTAAAETFRAVIESKLVPKGYFRNYLHDNLRWLGGKRLARCDAGRYSVAIDASGNVSGCLAHPTVGNLRTHALPVLLDQLDHAAIKRCSDGSTCNLLCARVVGSAIRSPLSGLRARRWRGKPLTVAAAVAH